MPEIKHNFTSGKMNKDFDVRLVPNGQYRDAMNIQVSTSEESDVGTAQNILGNSLIEGQGFMSESSSCVGSISDEKNDKLYYLVDDSEEMLKGAQIINTNVGPNAWNFPSQAINADFSVQNGVLIKSLLAPAGVISTASALFSHEMFNLVDGELYHLSVEFENIDNAGGPPNNLFIGGHPTNGNTNYKPLNISITTEDVYNVSFTFNKLLNNNSNEMRLSLEMTQGGLYEKKIKIKKISLLSKKGFIVEYSDKTKSITPVLVDKFGILDFNKNRLITGINIIDDIMLFTDNHSEPKKINITRCIEGTDPSGTIHTKLINKSRNIDISSNIDLQEQHITVIKKSPKIAPTIELISPQESNIFEYAGVMKITTDPGNLIAGALNTQNNSSFTGLSNHYHDFSQLGVGSEFYTFIETDVDGNSGFNLDWNVGDTVVLKEFTGNNYDQAPPLPITNYAIKAKILDWSGNTFTDQPAELAPNGDFALPDSDGDKPIGYDWSGTNITYEFSQYTSVGANIRYSNAFSYEKIVGTPNFPFVTGTGLTSGSYRIRYQIQGMNTASSGGATAVRFFISKTVGGISYRWLTPLVYANGLVDQVLTLDAGSAELYNGNYDGKFVIETGPGTDNSLQILNLSIEHLNAGNAAVKLEIIGIENTPSAVPQDYTELKYVVEKLDEEEKLFEFKFPRFAYRYQYEDKEYSAFSPFTQVAFLPGSFDYHPRNSYNLGMVNTVSEIKLSRFIPQSLSSGDYDDVVAVDILYKDESSANVYVVDTIRKDQFDFNAWSDNEYTIKSETIKRVLPSNQLLRPWDSVPKKALAQEISGNRVIYGNYVQGFNLELPELNNQQYYPNLNVSLLSKYQGLNTVKSIKSLRDYQLGVVFIDEYGRETPVLSNANSIQKITKKDSNKQNQLKVNFASTPFPKDVKYFKFFIKETSGEYYNMSMDRWWDAEDGLVWLSFPSSDINKIDIDTFLILKKGLDSNVLVEDKAKYKVLAIETEAPDHIKTKKTLIEEKTQSFSSTNDSVFGNTINDAPLFGRDSFKMNYAEFKDGTGSELHNISEGILYVEFAIGSVTSKRYRITQITTDRDQQDSTGNIIGANDAKFSVKLDKDFGEDINFICDDPSTGTNPTRIVDGTIVRIYKYLPENSSEFDGRFFVKIDRNEVFDTNIALGTSLEPLYRTTVSKKLYYMSANQGDLHDAIITGQNDGYYNDTGGTNIHAFGRFAPFFRNYKYKQDNFVFTLTGGTTVELGQYRFGSGSDWEYELAHFTAPTASFASDLQTGTTSSSNLKNADDHGYSDAQRYGVFNDAGEQTDGNVWFIDGGPWSGSRNSGSNVLSWNYVNNTDNSGTLGIASYFSSSVINISVGGIYHDEVCDGLTPNYAISNFYGLGLDSGNPYYNTQQFKDLISKISPSIKFRFREDPTDEIYTISPSGVTYFNRLRWTNGDHNVTGPSSGEFPAWDSVSPYGGMAAQLSPNHTVTYQTNFTNDATEDGTLSWDPTNQGVTGPIQNGLKLEVTAGTFTGLNTNQVFVSDIHDIACSIHGGKRSIAVGMILTSYASVSLDGSFENCFGSSGSTTFSHEPLIVSNILDVTGGYVLTLVGYTSILITASTGSYTTNSGITFKQHQIYSTNIASGNALVFRQPAMNGYSQYSVNRINQQDIPGGGWSIENPGLLAVGYNIEFVEEIELESGFPSNPAIWETEPKESTELDIYYEASGYNPLELNEETKYLAIPIGSKIRHNQNSSSIIPDTTVRGVFLFDGTTQSPFQISPAIAGTADNYYILTQTSLNPFSSAPLVGGNFINIGDSLSIEKPDGSVISVRVKGWMNEGLSNTYDTNRTEMIFIEKQLHSPLTSYVLNWHNCYSFGNGVESNRVRDTFNLPFIANGVKASTTLEENPYEEHLKYGLIYSGIYNSNSSVNNLNQFIAAEKITKDINPIYGSIQKLKAGWGQGGDLVTLCEDRVLKILANKDALFNADGNTNLTSTNNVLGQAIPYSGEYGISTNPESFASEAYRAYFTDKVRGTVMRLSMDGLTPISEAGMRDFFRDNLKLENKIIGSYDDRQQEYNLTLPTVVINDTQGVTVSYKEDVKGWVSFKSFIKENGVSCANNYYTFAVGKLWKHHNEDGDRNTFYDQFTASTINVLLNSMPSIIKSFHTLEYEGSASRKVDSSQAGWRVSSINTNYAEGSLPEFINKEGKWFNYIKGIESETFNDIDFRSLNFQGIGQAISVEMLDPTLFFNLGATLPAKVFINGTINSSLQQGDKVYFNHQTIAGGPFSSGTVIDIPDFVNNSFVIDISSIQQASVNNPADGSYWMFLSNEVYNMAGLSGYYADALFVNNSKKKVELYAVSSEISQSSK